jgi:hypothetical protein
MEGALNLDASKKEQSRVIFNVDFVKLLEIFFFEFLKTFGRIF